MSKKKFESVRLDPSARICPKNDDETIALYRVADRDEMGFRVVDDFVEEHIM